MNVRWLLHALTQLDRVYEYVAKDNPKAAKFIFTQIMEAAGDLDNSQALAAQGMSREPANSSLQISRM